MSLNFSSAALRELVTLTEKREKLLAEVASIEIQISAALGEASSGAANPSPLQGGSVGGKTRSAKPTQRGVKRGNTKELILGALKEAGTKGTSVKELSTKLGLKSANIHVWFATTGKKLAEKAGPGIYRLKESGVFAKAPVVAQSPEKKRSPNKGNRKTSAPKSKLAGKK